MAEKLDDFTMKNNLELIKQRKPVLIPGLVKQVKTTCFHC